jgi:hypothetical protein
MYVKRDQIEHIIKEFKRGVQSNYVEDFGYYRFYVPDYMDTKNIIYKSYLETCWGILKFDSCDMSFYTSKEEIPYKLVPIDFIKLLKNWKKFGLLKSRKTEQEILEYVLGK